MKLGERFLLMFFPTLIGLLVAISIKCASFNAVDSWPADNEAAVICLTIGLVGSHIVGYLLDILKFLRKIELQPKQEEPTNDSK